jgi:hypothetical protein
MKSKRSPKAKAQKTVVVLKPNARLRASLAVSEKEYKEGKFIGPFSNIDDLIAALDSKDHKNI